MSSFRLRGSIFAAHNAHRNGLILLLIHIWITTTEPRCFGPVHARKLCAMDDETTFVVKNNPISMVDLSGTSMTLDGALGWPLDKWALLGLYMNSPEHCRAIHVVAEAAFGRGLTGTMADRLEALCPEGSAALFTSLGVDLRTYGVACLYVVRDGRRRPLRLLHRPTIGMSRHKDGGWIQEIWNERGEREITRYQADEIIPLSQPCPAGGWYALPVWIGAAGMLELYEAAVAWNRDFFRNNAIPAHVIITKGQQLNDEQKRAAKEFFKAEFAGPGNGSRALYIHLNDKDTTDIEFKALAQHGKDADFLKLLDAARDRIPVAHGTPPRMLGIVAAGQLGGGGEVTGQFDIFQSLTVASLQTRVLGQLKPLGVQLGVDTTNTDQLDFVCLDLTPPQPLTPLLDKLVGAEILTAAEAREVIGRDNPGEMLKGAADGGGELRALVRLLERF